jgi:hypothetical protein
LEDDRIYIENYCIWFLFCHSRANGNPERNRYYKKIWIPAFAGMTETCEERRSEEADG